MATLSISSYVVLGLLAQGGSSTPYQLDSAIRESIGNFWSFPRSQLYAEAARLVRLGLVEERREEDGRRRRILTITDEGTAAFEQWRSGTAGEATEIRDEGLLRLYLQPWGGDDSDAVPRIAREQGRLHRERLAKFEQIVAAGILPEGSPQRATIEMGVRFERTIIAFWAELDA
jgi:PadR family transcriptional regulator, regulatory protein AphA